MARPDAFIFDMDGTLADNMPFHIRTWIELLAAEGVEVDAHTFHRKMAGQTNPMILRAFLGAHLTDADVARYADRKESLYRELYRPHLQAVEGLRPFLEETRRLGIPMALATAGTPPNIEFLLGGLGLDDFFEAVVHGDEVERGKPFPDIFLLAAERLGMAPERCLVFEDAPAGIEAARRAGMSTVVVATSLDEHEVAERDGVLMVVRDFTAVHPEALLGRAA